MGQLVFLKAFVFALLKIYIFRKAYLLDDSIRRLENPPRSPRNLKRVTITFDEKVLASLTDYAKERSQQDFSPFNLSSAVRKLLAEKLEELGYYLLPNEGLNSLKKEKLPKGSGALENKRQNQRQREQSLRSYADILYSFSIKGKKPSYITCKANLSWTIMKEYLKSLESLGFVSSSDEKRIYQLSHTGFRMLKQYLEVDN